MDFINSLIMFLLGASVGSFVLYRIAKARGYHLICDIDEHKGS